MCLHVSLFIVYFTELSRLRMMSAAYFLYLLLFSGLEYSLTFHVHQRFQYTRSDIKTINFYMYIRYGQQLALPSESQKARIMGSCFVLEFIILFVCILKYDALVYQRC